MGRSTPSCTCSAAERGDDARGAAVNQAIDFHAILPEMILAGTILVVLVADAFLPLRRKWIAMPLALLGTIASLVAVFTLYNTTRTTFGGMFVVDEFAVLF